MVAFKINLDLSLLKKPNQLMNEVIQLIISCISLLLFLLLLHGLIRISAGGIVIAISEIFFVSGVLLAPIIFLLDISEPAILGQYYISANGMPGLGTVLHIFMYVIGSILGLILVKKRNIKNKARKYLKYSETILRGNTELIILLSTLSCYAIYFYFVGFSTALSEAAAMRSGNFEGIGEGKKFAFLKTLGESLTVIIVCMMPNTFVTVKENRKGIILIFIYFLIVGLVFFNSISRIAILNYILIPIAVSMFYRTSKLSHLIAIAISKRLLIILPILLFGFYILIYGKSLGSLFSHVKDTGDFTARKNILIVDNIFLSLISSAEHSFFSNAAGIKNFMHKGAFIAKDIILSPIGFIPTRVLEYLGLSWLAVGSVSDHARMQCYNSFVFTYPQCVIPATSLAFIAYILPWVGAFFYGFVRFYLFGAGALLWQNLQKFSLRHIWIAYLYIVVVNWILSFNPNRVSQAFFIILMVMSIYIFNKIRIRAYTFPSNFQ